jgi:hypothetical protein
MLTAHERLVDNLYIIKERQLFTISMWKTEDAAFITNLHCVHVAIHTVVEAVPLALRNASTLGVRADLETVFCDFVHQF